MLSALDKYSPRLQSVKKAAKAKLIFRGVKEVTKALRKKEKGFDRCLVPRLILTLFRRNRICVFAGDISPIDVITHMPILCEEANVQYVYVPSKEVCFVVSVHYHPFLTINP